MMDTLSFELVVQRIQSVGDVHIRLVHVMHVLPKHIHTKLMAAKAPNSLERIVIRRNINFHRANEKILAKHCVSSTCFPSIQIRSGVFFKIENINGKQQVICDISNGLHF